MRRRVFIAACLVAAPLAYLGGRALFGRSPLTSAPTPLARVGFALQADKLQASPGDWAGLRADLETVRAAWPVPERDVLALIFAVRGLGADGQPDWGKADILCRTLRWPRCDRAALEKLASRGRASDAGATELEAVPALAVADATWALGSEEAVRNMVRSELDRLPESQNLRRARVFLRFGIIDTNPDGQAALFAQACVADPKTCDHLEDAAKREVQARLIAPGNVLPLYFGGHPPAQP